MLQATLVAILSRELLHFQACLVFFRYEAIG
jgi:hypothetical protein